MDKPQRTTSDAARSPMDASPRWRAVVDVYILSWPVSRRANEFSLPSARSWCVQSGCIEHSGKLGRFYESSATEIKTPLQSVLVSVSTSYSFRSCIKGPSSLHSQCPLNSLEESTETYSMHKYPRAQDCNYIGHYISLLFTGVVGSLQLSII